MTKPAQHWRLHTRTLSPGEIPLLMGIINVTPDSFSDAGRFLDPQAAVQQGLKLAAEGADLLDVGGQSTRPRSEPVTADEELRRVMPVITALYEQTSLPVSIDTSKAAVAREALAAGAEVVNDVTALSGDPEMMYLAAESRCGVCLMHMLGTPRTMQQAPVYEDVVAEVIAYLRRRRDAAIDAGIDPARIAVDPGIGFGKTLQHNLALLRPFAEAVHRRSARRQPGRPDRRHDRSGPIAGPTGRAGPSRPRRGSGSTGVAAGSGHRGE